MGKRIIKVVAESAPKAVGPYSQAVIASEALVYVSGQLGIDPKTGDFISQTVRGQTRQCLENLRAVLEAAGAEAGSVVKTTVYLRNIEDFDEMNSVYAEFFKDPYPARACVAVRDLPRGALVEIDAIAIKS